jgi:hypothetical protein
MFFNEVDEGLWFYLRGFELVPVPGSHPRYNSAFDLAEMYRTERLPSETLGDLEAKRLAHDKRMLIDWLDHSAKPSSCVVIRSHLYDRFADDLSGRVKLLLRETGMKRNELVLLRADGAHSLTSVVVAIGMNWR